jgi:hypothetical protein
MKSKIILVYKDVEDNIAEETVWAVPLGNSLYQIDNIPFYAPNLSYNDIIKVENDNGLLYFDSLEQPSGHSTIQVIFFDDGKSMEVLDSLVSLGCRWEGMKEQPYYAIDIPPNIDYESVRILLDKAFQSRYLDYKESCLA